MISSPAAAPAAPAPPGTESPVADAGEIPPASIAADPAIENDDSTDTDSASVLSSTASISESITEYRRILGRTYTQKTDYWGPNDERQNEGLELAHYTEMVFFDDKLFLAPIGENPQKVLDVGTGTGIWAIDFADEFPSSDVIGVDISPIQPSWVPPNCKFQIDDIEESWTWPIDFFNFIHIRHLEASVSDWPKLYSQCFEHLVPGGYLEVNEMDYEDHSQALGDAISEDHIFRRWEKTFTEATNKLGKTAIQTRNHGIANAMRDAGFVDVVEKSWPFPIGGWASDPKLKEVGAVNLEYIDQSLEGFGLFLLKNVMGWEDAEILVFISEMRKALRDLKLQPYYRLYVVYGRKPTEEEVSGEQSTTVPLA
ncbi:UMTA [Colletotrichum melonis]|uniref:UMTA n=1 Tax=Colletotrichum melonis TaxID=1209925 RepID=A0AAI9USK1_9PEZI|nr:UMTA [Colletotrichum melonis]